MRDLLSTIIADGYDAVGVLRALHCDVFPGVTTEAVKRSYMRAIKRTGSEDLRFHDPRTRQRRAFLRRG